MNNEIPKNFISKLLSLLDESEVLTDPMDLGPYLKDQRGLMESNCSIVVRPSTSQQVAEVVRVCNEFYVTIVPLGGNTGLVGGGIASGGIILSLEKLNRIIELDPINHTITLEAGCILTNVQIAAEEANCLFPLSLGAEGSCQIGGNLSTNAGGVGVLHYGNARELVLGLEVVLPDGRIYEDLSCLRKDNTGYDLKQLFIGAEGTLGIITKAVLKLFPMHHSSLTAIVAFKDIDHTLTLFNLVRSQTAEKLKAFEYIPRLALDLGLEHVPGIRDPFSDRYPHYALIELASSTEKDDLKTGAETILEEALRNGILENAVIAESESQAKQLWKIREEIPAAQSKEGESIKHDVSVPISTTIQFIKQGTKLAEDAIPGVRICAFGHIGDGNIHFNLTQPIDCNRGEFIEYSAKINRIIHDLVTAMRGSISAEHGIGLSKRDDLYHYSSMVKIDLMRQIKQSVDPRNIMNPGKIIVMKSTA